MINSHPYYDGVTIEYYTSQTDARPIEDAIAGPRIYFALYAEQQISEKYPNSRMEFVKHLNGILYSRKYKGTVRHEFVPTENSDPIRTVNGAESKLAI